MTQEEIANHFGGASRRSVTYMMDLIALHDYGEMEQGMPENWRSLFNYVIQLAYTVPAEQSETGKAYRTTSAVIEQKDVSKFIEQLKKCPEKGKAAAKWQGRTPVHEDGMYRVGTDIYKVQLAVHGSGKLYAKKLIPANSTSTKGGVPKFKFVYAPGAMKLLSASDRLTIAQAQEFGKLYGACCVCARTLTNELSIHLGIGPVCGGREFGGDFEFMLKQAKMEIHLAEQSWSLSGGGLTYNGPESGS